MCKIGIVYDENINQISNVAFIDDIANILRDSKDKEDGYLPEEYKNVIIPMLVITRLDMVLMKTKSKVLKRKNS
ncbi:type I restriction-modification system subunit M N-terminal domain-containing protein [Clostridium senegalense]|uniref:type I restriction-modification system subunit M N-terminal domain-containing protein n=1 Tax=Clostridium senegalense TaxID=1465809 RepID=UPI000288D8B1|nr:type I restriction-modification system subunit M N-terminal domain-containing protein [Clostridium senegalense]